MRNSRSADESAKEIGGVLDFDGAAVVRQGLERRSFRDLYHYLVIAPWPAVIFELALAFAASTHTASGYVLIGGVANVRPGYFSDAFFFSVQTMATIGYGVMVPGRARPTRSGQC